MTSYTRTPLLYPKGMPTDVRFIAASSNKSLSAAGTYADLLASAFYPSRQVAKIGVYCILSAAATSYHLYCSRTSSATTIARELIRPATGGSLFYGNTGEIAYIAATQHEAINFLTDAWLGYTDASKRRMVLRKIIVWEEDF
jgi:hypothetical protein